MKHPGTMILLLAVFALAGCATTPRDPLAARKKAYERLASFLEPGMTRRQVYALLPPRRPPITSRSEDGGPSLHALLGPPGRQSEIHLLDSDFALSVDYILAKPRPAAPIDRADFPFRSQPRRSDSLAISAQAIDELLFGRKTGAPRRRVTRSKEDMDDRLFWRPVVVRDPSLLATRLTSLAATKGRSFSSGDVTRDIPDLSGFAKPAERARRRDR